MKKKILIGIGAIVAALGVSVYVMWGNEIKSLLSIEQIIEQDLSHKDGYTYEMNIAGIIILTSFWSKGSRKRSGIDFFYYRKITKGLIPMSIEESDIACSSFTAQTEDGDYLFEETMILTRRIPPLCTPIQGMEDMRLCLLWICSLSELTQKKAWMVCRIKSKCWQRLLCH